uniref:Tetraspanin n=1 Tax=Trieres chinensis TaxID=1514140 RepID=A0A7S2ECJ8_TRICV|mmetsp:Transcript_16828/g.34518  ORF Transcript_16828/g.34518 Transcript_16828/m.34518 type:complete len:342 (+) Transcript_16828:264-1289(+)
MTSGRKRTRAAQFLLVLINLAFLAAGILFIVYAVKMNDSAWMEVIDENLPWVRTLMIACTVALGSVVIILSFMGCLGAFFKKRGLLCCYNFFMVLALILVAIVMAGSFTSMALASDWAGKEYPATNQEPYVAVGFNRLYCTAEGAYLCSAAPMGDVIKSLAPGILSEVSSIAKGINGINSLCDEVESKLDLFGAMPDQLADLCKECEKMDDLEVFAPTLEWVDGHCPISEAGEEVIEWCGDFLFKGEAGREYDGAPYGVCRPSFLTLWSDTSKKLGLGLVGFFIFQVIIIVSVCVMRRKRNFDDQHSENAAHKKSNKDGSDVEQPSQSEPYQGASAPVTVY